MDRSIHFHSIRAKISYFFINDFSKKKNWVYFLKQKIKSFCCFQKFQDIVEKESRYSIKSLGSDWGAKFTSKDFNEFYKTYGIHHPLAIPRSSQLNGVDKGRTESFLTRQLRCMLKAKNIINKWDETIS